MVSLRELQLEFVNALNNRGSHCFDYICATRALTAEEHLHIYKSNIVGALQKVLKEIYPVCHKLVGDDFFLYLINAYIEQNSSTHPDIGSYGGSLPDFIADFENAKALVYLPDVARLEWAWHRQFVARQSPGIDFEKLAACYTDCGEEIIFSLPLDCVLLCSPYPIHRIWEVNQHDYSGDQTVVLTPDNYYYLIWRKGLQMRIDILEQPEWQILQWVHLGHQFGVICEKINELVPEIDIETLMPKLVSKGFLADFRVS